jgi:hypothetical protein
VGPTGIVVVNTFRFVSCVCAYMCVYVYVGPGAGLRKTCERYVPNGYRTGLDRVFPGAVLYSRETGPTYLFLVSVWCFSLTVQCCTTDNSLEMRHSHFSKPVRPSIHISSMLSVFLLTIRSGTVLHFIFIHVIYVYTRNVWLILGNIRQRH